MEDYGSDQAIAGLVKIISQKAFRERFLKDPRGTLNAEGVDAGKIPGELIDTLASLSEPELEALSRVRDAVKKSKVKDEHAAQIV